MPDPLGFKSEMGLRRVERSLQRASGESMRSTGSLHRDTPMPQDLTRTSAHSVGHSTHPITPTICEEEELAERQALPQDQIRRRKSLIATPGSAVKETTLSVGRHMKLVHVGAPMECSSRKRSSVCDAVALTWTATSTTMAVRKGWIRQNSPQQLPGEAGQGQPWLRHLHPDRGAREGKHKHRLKGPEGSMKQAGRRGLLLHQVLSRSKTSCCFQTCPDRMHWRCVVLLMWKHALAVDLEALPSTVMLLC